MRCYVIATKDKSTFRYAGTNADARETKKELAVKLGLPERTKEILIEDAEVPLKKEDLLDFINGFAKKLSAV